MNEAKSPARVLVVDDEERNRRLLVAMLEAEGYATTEAADGPQALAAVRACPPDLILLDIMMPGMDGYEVARALKADAGTKAVPVIMVTTETEMEHMALALEAGANEYVMKPFTREILTDKLRLAGVRV